PLTFSVLPIAPYTETIVEEANRRGRELMLHLPMEPKNYPSFNPGPGALLADMSEAEIRRL
ncbi:MAG: divergent polysaccharide deacetylase family protein, partial [Deltaproteobacteria bacterium]|nr:divergent polysaccharide deacetylase family protein [Gammaproteobacteria bacterium]NIS76900.1 divergent polysaccharide deacetylase family protein [Deltaproteobacteria bacterium]NIT05563.1 divergent polysaccharide deacetylase family protein [Gammaproteobacteria bacterium]